jgi:hypothetical protein
MINERPHPIQPTSDHADLARKLCLLGATDDDLARLLEVPRATLDAWLAEVPEFAAAVRAGRDLADANVADRLYARAMGYSHEATKVFNNRGEIIRETYLEHYPPDVQAGIFWMRNRCATWRNGGDSGSNGTGADLLAELEAAGERARNARRR